MQFLACWYSHGTKVLDGNYLPAAILTRRNLAPTARLGACRMFGRLYPQHFAVLSRELAKKLLHFRAGAITSIVSSSRGNGDRLFPRLFKATSLRPATSE